MTKLNIKTSKKVVPMCYAYTTPQIKDHDGWTKIGFTEQDVDTRIRQQTQTADIEYKIEWKANAIYDDGSGDIFHDTDFHGYLKKVGIERKTGTEWFHILPQVSKQRFDEFRANRGVSQTDAVIEYKLREEQQKAVEQAKAYFKNHTEEDAEFLWNAKPRFGKTLSAYDLCKQLDAKTVLIVTHRPAIATSWYSDYEKFLGTQSGYYFISQADALKDKPSVVKRENLPAWGQKDIFAPGKKKTRLPYEDRFRCQTPVQQPLRVGQLQPDPGRSVGAESPAGFHRVVHPPCRDGGGFYLGVQRAHGLPAGCMAAYGQSVAHFGSGRNRRQGWGGTLSRIEP